MLKLGRRSVFTCGFVALTLTFVNPHSHGDVLTLQDLLNGESITSNGLTYENFRSYVSLAGNNPGPASSIEVNWTDLGLTFTGINGAPLAGFPGQGPFGASFKFDVAAAPNGGIGIAGVSVTGSVGAFGTMNPDPPYFTASLSIVGADPSPLNLSATQQNNGQTGMGISSTVSAAATFPNATFITVSEYFASSGLTDHAYGSPDQINSVSVAFVPEPSPLTLVVVFGTAMMLVVNKKRRRD